MWRSVALGVVLAGVLAGCSLGGGDGAASQTSKTGYPLTPIHKFRVPNGTSRSFAAGRLTYPLTVGCPKPVGATNRSGFHQVIRTPITHGTFYGDSTNGTSITITVRASGRIEFACS